MRFSGLARPFSWVPEPPFFRRLFWNLALQVLLFLLGTSNNCEQMIPILEEHVKITSKTISSSEKIPTHCWSLRDSHNVIKYHWRGWICFSKAPDSVRGAFKVEWGCRACSAHSHIANPWQASGASVVSVTCLVSCRGASCVTLYQTVLVQHLEDSKGSSCPGQPGGFSTEILVFFAVLDA